MYMAGDQSQESCCVTFKVLPAQIDLTINMLALLWSATPDDVNQIFQPFTSVGKHQILQKWNVWKAKKSWSMKTSEHDLTKSHSQTLVKPWLLPILTWTETTAD